MEISIVKDLFGYLFRGQSLMLTLDPFRGQLPVSTLYREGLIEDSSRELSELRPLQFVFGQHITETVLNDKRHEASQNIKACRQYLLDILQQYSYRKGYFMQLQIAKKVAYTILG